MVRVQSFRCAWCGIRGHAEEICKQKRTGKLPTVNRLRNAICNNILKKHILKKYIRVKFYEWRKLACKTDRPRRQEPVVQSRWLMACNTVPVDPIVKKYFLQWQINAFALSLIRCQGMRWADID